MRKLLDITILVLTIVIFAYCVTYLVDWYYSSTVGDAPDWLVQFMRDSIKK